ncbi:Crp/Fnr family transcriptional regulator [Chitinophagaceae bacterium LWZ2-11]
MDHTLPHEYITRISTLSDEEFSLLTEAVEKRDFKKGDKLLKEGDVCRSFYLVDKGYLRTYYNKEGVAINLNFTFEGSFTSNLKSVKSKQGSEVTIEAGEDSSVWVFNINTISERFKLHPQILLFVRRLTVRLLLASEEHSNLFKIYTPTERYRYIEKNNPQLLQRISLSQMASYLGVTRETLSRIRSKRY